MPLLEVQANCARTFAWIEPPARLLNHRQNRGEGQEIYSMHNSYFRSDVNEPQLVKRAEALDAGEEARADEDASGTERECRGKPAPVGDAAGQPAARMS